MKFNVISKIFVLVLISSLVNSTVIGQCNELDVINQKKTAIVFGEKDYQFAGALTNPLHDAVDISDSLKKLGFVVYTYQNTDRKTMEAVLEDWYAKISKYDVALIYYSGHGAEMNGENWLFPVDAHPKSQTDVLYQAYSANRLLAKMEENNTKCNIMILDACRNNPFTKNWARDMQGGLTSMTGKGSFIGFAASPGQTASDGINRNGTYTEGILKYITTPGLPIDQIFTKVNAYVRSKTSETQRPFKNSSLSVDFCFSVKSEKTKAKATKSSFIQPASSILLGPKLEKLYSLDSSGNRLMFKDARTLVDLQIAESNKIRSYKLTTRKGDRLYIIDSVSKSLLVVDAESGNLNYSLQLPFKPLSIAVNIDENKAYLTGEQIAHKGSINVIDLNQKKIISTITYSEVLSGILVSPNGKYIYSISSSDTNKRSLVILDAKTEKQLKVIEGIASGEAIGITPDNKKIYVSYTDDNKNNRINVLDCNSLKLLKTINVISKSFAFTPDSKFIFAVGTNEISIINSYLDTIIKNLPFATETQSLTISDDYKGFVRLPVENRIYIFDITENLKEDTIVDLETKLKNYKEELHKKELSDIRFRIKGLMDTTREVIFMAPYLLAKEIGSSCIVEQNSLNFNYDNLVYVDQISIKSTLNSSKVIKPSFEAVYTNDQFTLSIRENGKEEVIKANLKELNWSTIGKFVRDYYIKHIDQLR